MQLISRIPSRHYFIILFLSVSLLFVTFSAVIYHNFAQAQKLNRWTLYNYELLRQCRKVLFDLVDMETGMRGYLLTGKPSFLQPYKTSKLRLAQEIRDLWAFAKNDYTTQDNIDLWLKKIESFAATLDAQLVHYTQQGSHSVSQSQMVQQKAQMDSLRNALEDFIQVRLNELNAHIKMGQDAQRDFRAIITIGTILGIGAMLLATLIITALVRRSEEAENAAQDAESRYRLVLNGVNDGLFDLDVHTGKIFLSPTYKQMLGYNEHELGDSSEELKKLLHPDDAEKTWAVFNAFREGKSDQYRNVFRMRHKSGDWLWIMSRGVAVRNAQGDITRLIGTHTDITAEKHREEELRLLSQEMETFTYITSHDLRAPLVNLKGFASELELTLREIAPLLHRAAEHLAEPQRQTLTQAIDADIPEALRFIDQSVDKMDALTSAVLDLSRIGKRVFRSEPVDVNAVIRRCLDSQAFEIQQKQIDVSAANAPTIISDPIALEQIFSNVIDNAVKYLDPERPGTIRIQSETIGDIVIFSIVDNGRGIAAGDHEKVFQIFRRARNSQDVRGIGMGMAFVQSTLRRLGGNIWFESEPGRGTTFFFSLPQKPAVKGVVS